MPDGVGKTKCMYIILFCNMARRWNGKKLKLGAHSETILTQSYDSFGWFYYQLLEYQVGLGLTLLAQMRNQGDIGLLSCRSLDY